jgi:CrcB protein
VTALYVGIFGMIGAVIRYLIGAAVHPSGAPFPFPFATLLINLTGSFALGWLTEWSPSRFKLSPEWRTALQTGFIGAYTTFSTLSLDTFELLERQAWAAAAGYVLASLWGGLLFAAWGSRIARSRTSREAGREQA